MAGGFLSGFAEGYITERKRKIERQESLDDQSFQYQMKTLTDQREKRDEKKKKEAELAKRAKYLAGKMGDEAFASTAYNEMTLGGLEPSEVESRINKGYYQKNEAYVKPVKTVKVPNAVSMEAANSQFPVNERVNKRIDAIDPTLRQAPVEEENEFTTIAEGEDSPYIFKASHEVEAGNLEDAVMARDLAIENKDPEAERKANLRIKSITTATAMEAQAKAQQENKDANLYLYKDEKGNIISTLSAEIGTDGRLYNTETGDLVDVQNKNQLVRVSEPALKEWQSLDETIGTKSADLRAGSANFISALDTTNRVAAVLARSPEVTTWAASGIELAKNLEGEAGVAYNLLFEKEQEIKDRMRTGNMEGMEGMLARYQEDAKEFLEKADKGLLGSTGNRIAADKAIYDTLRNSLTFQMAAANGLTASRMTDADFKRFWDMIGGDKRDPNAVLASIQNTAQIVLTGIDSQRKQFNDQPMITGFIKRHRFDPGVRLKRIEEMLIEDERPDLVETFKMLKGDIELRRINAAESAEEQNATADIDPDDADILRANPSEEYQKYFDETYGPGAAARVLGR